MIRRIKPIKEAASSITCPRCSMTSYNLNDVKQKYCGNCHMFHADMVREPNLAEYHDETFRKAAYFTTWRKMIRFGNQRKEFPTFPEAALDAGNDPRALVYAVMASGRSICLVRDAWAHYLELWKEMHGIPNHDQ